MLEYSLCPGCGARYRTAGLAPGKEFRCRKCGAFVAVACADDAGSAIAAGPSPSPPASAAEIDPPPVAVSAAAEETLVPLAEAPADPLAPRLRSFLLEFAQDCARGEAPLCWLHPEEREAERYRIGRARAVWRRRAFWLGLACGVIPGIWLWARWRRRIEARAFAILTDRRFIGMETFGPRGGERRIVSLDAREIAGCRFASAPGAPGILRLGLRGGGWHSLGSGAFEPDAESGRIARELGARLRSVRE